MAHFIGKKIRLTIVDGGRTYEGYVHSLDQQNQLMSLQKVVIPETGKKLNGLQTYFGPDISSIDVLEEEFKTVEDCETIIPDRRERGPRILRNKHNPSHLNQLRDFNPSNHLLRNVANDVDRTTTSEHSPKQDGKSSDYDSSSDQDTLDFEDCIYISKINQRFHDVISHLKEQSEIGVSFSGVCIGRDGKLSLIQIATSRDVFIFDMITLGPKCWDVGLKSIFEDPRLSKVMHDCRFTSDMLHHKFDVKLVNIFDTQVAEVFVYRLYHHGGWPKWVNGLSCSLFDHLDLPTEMVNNLKIRETLKKEDQEVWIQRPLPKNLLKIAIKEVIHLIQLRHVLMEKMMGEYVAGVDVYLSHVREASKEDYKKYQNNTHKLPVAFENLSGLLAGRDSHRYNRHRYNRGPQDNHDYNKDSYGFRENCRGFVGMDVRYSNSSIWHEGAISGSKSNNKNEETENKLTKLTDIKSGNHQQVNNDNVSSSSETETLTPSLNSTSNNIPTSSQERLKSGRKEHQPCNQTDDNVSDQEMSLGRWMRSKIRHDSDTDIDLIPAGIMFQGGKLKQPKQKRLSEIEQMSNKVEEIHKALRSGNDMSNFPPNERESSPFEKTWSVNEGNNSSMSGSPKHQNISFQELYSTAPTTPNQSFGESNLLDDSPGSKNVSLIEDYKTPPPPTTSPANSAMPSIGRGMQLGVTIRSLIGRLPKSIKSQMPSFSESQSSLEESLNTSSPSRISSFLQTTNLTPQESPKSPQVSSSDGECPPLFTYQNTFLSSISSDVSVSEKCTSSETRGDNFQKISSSNTYSEESPVSSNHLISEPFCSTSSKLKSTQSNLERVRILREAAKKSPK